MITKYPFILIRFGNEIAVRLILLVTLRAVPKFIRLGNKHVVMAGFKDIMIEKYLKKLQDDGLTVVVYTQDEAAKNTTRSLQGIYSPGTYFADETTNLTNNLTCVWIELVNNKMILKECSR